MSFEDHRRFLLAIAYRMLGSAAEAEDAVQDAWLRWRTVTEIRDEKAWLSTTVARICLDRLGSARARREAYVGSWLPEPVATNDPFELESISTGVLVLLERLDPIERAVFVLRHAFDFAHADIADALGITEVASRQALHRARAHVTAGKPRFASDRATLERMLHAFVAAVRSGDVDAIAAILTEDATLHGDGGGKVRGAILLPIEGRDRVARFFAGLLAKTTLAPDLVASVEDVNGMPALVGRTGAGVSFVITIETDGARITTIRNVVNPDKLSLRRVD